MLQEIFNSIYLTSYSVSTVAGFVTWTICALFITFLPNKTFQGKLLAIITALFGAAYFFYFISQSFYYPLMFARPAVLVIILYIYTIQVFFFLHFPNPAHPKFARNSLIFNLTLSTGMAAYIFYSTQHTDLFYQFDGHFYEYDMPTPMKLYSISILYIVFFNFFTVLWNLIKSPKEDKKFQSIFLLGVIVEGIISAILNFMNRAGIISRDLFFSIYMVVVITGFFIIMVGYINRTTDRISFMFKIVSISFLTFVIIFNILNVIVMREFSKNFDYSYTSKLKMIVKSEEPLEDVDYILKYDPVNDDLKYIFNKNNISFDLSTKYSLIDTYLLEKFTKDNLSMKSIDIINYLKEVKIKDSKYILGHLNYIKDYLETYEPEKPLSNSHLVEFIFKNQRKLFQLKNSIHDLPNHKFREELEKIISKQNTPLLSFHKQIQEHLKNSNVEGKELKKEVLNFVELMQLGTSRRFREAIDPKYKYISFAYYNPSEQTIYEIGINYLSYRKYQHIMARDMVWIFLIAIVVLVVGIPLFLLDALVNPLLALVEGIRQVRKGHLDTSLPIKVHDEIGFLTESFNNMVHSIKDSKEKLEEYSNHLEEKVEERTRELQETLTQVENLKTQQDGDYFLTTLLLKPLSGTKPKTEKVKIDFFVKQKKSFSFKKKYHDIGGDTCISNVIHLKGKKYIVFLNADAMGKSMQGAGGILVLGSVFHSIIQRTLSYPDYSNVYPEFWIKAVFKEMHKIFETFDGSMLISLIFGLVEEDTGLVYFMNAEHPWMILQRDGKAEFIESDTHFRKLGTSGMDGEIFISTFPLSPGDVLIMGSDGKDDVVLRSYEDGSRVINEDETLILKRVQEANGDLNKIFQVICEKYELMDDFSLLSIHYPFYEVDVDIEINNQSIINNYKAKAKELIANKNFNAAIRELEAARMVTGDLSILKHLINLYIKLKKYDEASKLSKEYLDKNSADIQMMQKISLCFKMNKEFKEAIEIGERIKLREPGNISNLLHLADMYAYTGNLRRADKILNKVILKEPNNLQVQSLISKVVELKAMKTQGR